MQDPALIQAIEDALNRHPDGLIERDIRKQVVESGLRRQIAEIRAALTGEKAHFVGLADGRWRLSALLKAEEIVAAPEDVSDARAERGEEVVPFLASLPRLDAFVAFDLETTGTKPESDRIIQISAVRMEGGSPIAVFNEYVNLAGRTMPYGLKVKLGFADHPEWAAALSMADSLGDVLARFRLWIGDLPLVAHNARFDMGFLKVAAVEQGWEITNSLVDSMELACLATPERRSFQLAELAQALGIGANTPDGEQVEAWAKSYGVEEFSWQSFHNAVVDVLVLAALLPRLIHAIRERAASHPAFAALCHLLLPGAAASLEIARPLLTEDEDPGDLIHALPQHPVIPTERADPIPLDATPSAIKDYFAAMGERQGQRQRLHRRESQLAMVEAIARGLRDERFQVIEAPTGTGKTFAYLVPSILWARQSGETVAIATYTRLLQDQMADDLERVSNSIGIPFRHQVLKGMNNYVCLERAAALFAQNDLEKLDAEERFAWLLVCAWLTVTVNGTPDEISYWAQLTFPALGHLLGSLRAERGECSYQRCADCELCFHQLAYRRAEIADVVVMNHALLLAKEWEESGMPFTRVMIDEAHNLEGAVTNAATDEVTWESGYTLIRRLLDRRTGQGLLVRLRDKVRSQDGQKMIAVAIHQRNLLEGLVRDFGARLARYAELNQAQVDPRYGAKLTLEADPRQTNPTSWPPVQTARDRLIAALRENGQILHNLLVWLMQNPLPLYQNETVNEMRYLRDKFQEEGDLLRELLWVGYDRLVRVHWIEVERAIPFEGDPRQADNYRGPYRWAVKRAPVRVGPILNDELYTGKKTVVFTSATLRTTQEDNFGFILGRLGLQERVQVEDAIALPAELNYSRALFGIARYLRSDARTSEIQNFVDEVGKELGWFFRFTGGNGLALFTARTRMQEVFAELEPVLNEESIPVGCQGESASRRSLLEDLKGRPGSVVLGLKSFWEGVDVPGPNLCYVLMEKLPFPLLGEPVIRARAAEIRNRGGHEFTSYILPLMLIDFKQGFGRLIRSETDIGAVLLLDKRVWNREYRRDLFAALPGVGEGDDRSPKLIPEESLRSRRAVYEAIAEHMAGAPAEWKIDLERMRAILDVIPNELLTRLERLLAELQLPDIVSIEELRLLWDRVVRAMSQLFQFTEWRSPQQSAAVEAILTGRDALIVLPTGSGKSFTFQLPALLRNGTTIVFSPLKALMKDQVDKLLDRGLAVAERVDSSQGAEEQERVYQRMREGTARIVYIAPERMRDPKLMAALRSAKNIVQVVVDEAHCVHMWGQSFRPDFLYISQLVDAITQATGRRPPVAALTATATPAIRRSIVARLQLRPDFVEIEDNPNRPELRFVVYNRTSAGMMIRGRRDKERALLRILRAADRNDESAIVYVNTTREADRLARRLETQGLDARCYHGKMDDQARKDVQDMFLDGQIRTIVATKAFGMGVDKPDIRYVIHYEMPADIESYYQEAGRAGRDGKTSWAILLYHPKDVEVHSNFFIPKSLPAREEVQEVWRWLLRRWNEAKADTIYVDPHAMADALGFDEEASLGIHLHLLEELGALHRRTDITGKASARLLSSLETIDARAQELDSGAAGRSVRPVLEAQEVRSIARSEIDLLAGADRFGINPAQLDDLFYRLALEGHLIYRAFARSYTLQRTSVRSESIQSLLNPQQFVGIQKEMYEKLAAMQRYAENLRPGHCLRKEILHYLGAEKPLTKAEECCSLCAADLPALWNNQPMFEDLADPERYQDAKYAVLKAVAWNGSLVDTRGRNPYGAWTLAQIVVGNDYQATRYENDAGRREARRRVLVSGEHYGVLEGLKGGSDTVLALLNELRQSGYVSDLRREWNGNGYDYPAPTEKGVERVRIGRLFTEPIQTDQQAL